jgi:sugar phosphate isomerase/epimerase
VVFMPRVQGVRRGIGYRNLRSRHVKPRPVVALTCRSATTGRGFTLFALLIPALTSDSVVRMKLCISTLTCPTWSLNQIVETLSANGITGIDFRGLESEIDITRLDAFDGQLDQTLSLLQRHGLSMPCLNTSVTLVSPDPQRWQTMLDEAQRYAKLAQRTGTKLLRIFGGGVPKGMTRDEARIMAQRHLRQVIKICKPHGCQPVLETHDDWATGPRVLELIHEFDPSEVAVLWDLEHPARQGESPADTARQLRKFIRHIHVKDTVMVDGKRHPVLMGAGVVPLVDCAATLSDIGFDGWYCLEVEKRWDPEAPEPEESVPAFAKYMRERWNR